MQAGGRGRRMRRAFCISQQKLSFERRDFFKERLRGNYENQDMLKCLLWISYPD
jgi:hypothetical protein